MLATNLQFHVYFQYLSFVFLIDFLYIKGSHSFLCESDFFQGWDSRAQKQNGVCHRFSTLGAGENSALNLWRCQNRKTGTTNTKWTRVQPWRKLNSPRGCDYPYSQNLEILLPWYFAGLFCRGHWGWSHSSFCTWSSTSFPSPGVRELQTTGCSSFFVAPLRWRHSQTHPCAQVQDFVASEWALRESPVVVKSEQRERGVSVELLRLRLRVYRFGLEVWKNKAKWCSRSWGAASREPSNRWAMPLLSTRRCWRSVWMRFRERSCRPMSNLRWSAPCNRTSRRSWTSMTLLRGTTSGKSSSRCVCVCVADLIHCWYVCLQLRVSFSCELQFHKIHTC